MVGMDVAWIGMGWVSVDEWDGGGWVLGEAVVARKMLLFTFCYILKHFEIAWMGLGSSWGQLGLRLGAMAPN